MNENQPMAEPELLSLMNRIISYEETRDKQISEINEILDRIKMNRQSEPARTPSVQDKVTGASPFVVNLYQSVKNMDLANEKLGLIIKRLHELI